MSIIGTAGRAKHPAPTLPRARGHFSGFRLGLLFAVLLCLPAVAADVFEKPPSFQAEKALPADLWKGAHHQVLDPVLNDGYLNQYRIKSRFGEFEARGTFLLRIRVPEIQALDELDNVSKTKVFLESAKNSALGPVHSVVGFAEDPGGTVKEIPGGVGRMFKKIGRTAKKGYESVAKEDEKDQSEKQSASKKLVEHYFGITDAERKWAQKVGSDPYTSNKVLSKAVHDIAIVDRAGSFTVKLAPIPSIPGMGTLDTVYQLAWSKNPYELKEFNQKRLKEMGVGPEVIESFFQNGWLSPTVQTLLISTLVEMSQVEGRPLVIQQSLDLESEIEANFFLQNLTLLSWFHKTKGGLKRFLTETPLPAAEARDGRFVALLATDYIAWTKEIQEAAARLTAAYQEFAPARRELWVQGGISERCRAEVEKLGWTVKKEIPLDR